MMADHLSQPTYSNQLLPNAVTPSPRSTPRISTISTFTAKPTFIPRPRFKTGNGQCTHLTMTRMYTREFRCVLCLRTGSMGWVYRCTQDRELLIEDDMERGNEDKIDKLCDIFERSTSPRKRSPAARLSKLSFFEEVNDEQLHTYTGAQLSQILAQREKVLDLASQPELGAFNFEPFPSFPRITNTLFPSPDIISSMTPPVTQKKPWIPLKGGECQFKCCHFCRPTSVDRTYLSLNGIANDDIPLTAITGFGFHLSKKRPVALVKHVQNLGLRPSPPPRLPGPRNLLYRLPHPLPNSLIPTDPSLGLGIFANTETSLSSEVIPSPPQHFFPSIPEYGPQVHTTFREIALRYPRPRRIRACEETEASMVPLPEQTQEELAMISAPLTPMEELELDKGVFGSAPLEVNGGVAVMEESVELRVADVVTQF